MKLIPTAIYFSMCILFLCVACAPTAAPTPTVLPTVAATMTTAPTSTTAPTLTPPATATATPSPFAPRITLNASQREALIKIINSDAEAKSRYDSIKRTADGALTMTPNPIALIQTEGKLDADPVSIKSRESMRDMNLAFALGITYAVTNDAKYSAKTKEFVLAWARVNQPAGNPIDETNFDNMFFAYDLTRATFSADEMSVADAWLRKIATAEMASYARAVSQRSTTAKNNWNNHRMKIVGLIGFLLPDQPAIDFAMAGYKQQIADDLNPDGSTFDFHERDALHYHVYSLEPLLVLARVAEMNKVALYSYQAPSGASLPKSMAFLVPYADGAKTHAEFVNSTVKFDRDRAAAGQAQYQAGALFDVKEASHALEFNYFFDPTMLSLVIKVNKSTAVRYPTFQILMEAAQK